GWRKPAWRGTEAMFATYIVFARSVPFALAEAEAAIVAIHVRPQEAVKSLRRRHHLVIVDRIQAEGAYQLQCPAPLLGRHLVPPVAVRVATLPHAAVVAPGSLRRDLEPLQDFLGVRPPDPVEYRFQVGLGSD